MKLEDSSFREPGSVPFKWEVRPGVPKLQHLDNYPFDFNLRTHKPSPETPTRLKPPPAGFYFHSPVEPRTPSFRYNYKQFGGPSFRSNSKRFGVPGLARAEVVSTGCFPSPMSKRKSGKKGKDNPGSEPGYYSDFESGFGSGSGSSRRLSVSSRKSMSPLSYSHRASPNVQGDLDWAGFGLF